MHSQRKLAVKLDEVLAYFERAKKLNPNDSDTATSMEYLKNCIFRFMASTDLSEKKRLYPVIATILKLTAAEKQKIELTMHQIERTESSSDVTEVISSIGESIESWWGSIGATTSALLSINPGSTSDSAPASS